MPQAANYLILLWGGMMVGRFAGAASSCARIRADRVLAVFAAAAFVVMIGAATLHGPIAMWALILVGLCHSIMFPTIFALGIKGLGPLTEEGSGLLITAIAGGALVVVQGWLADSVRPAELVLADRRLRALRVLVRALGQPGNQSAAAGDRVGRGALGMNPRPVGKVAALLGAGRLFSPVQRQPAFTQ